MFWKEFKALSEVCARAWGCGQGSDGRCARCQEAAPGSPPSLAKGPGCCRHSHEVQAVRVAVAGHASLLHPHCTKPYPPKALLPPFAGNWHSHHLLGQPSSDEDLLLSCGSVRCPCAYPSASQEALGRHSGEAIWQWCRSGGLFLFY